MGNIKIEKDSVVLTINPKIYPLSTIYSAAYVFLDRAYVLLDGEPEKSVIVRLKPKQKEDFEKLGMEFFNELVNYADYQKRAEQTKAIRGIILQRALLTNDPSLIEPAQDKEIENLAEELEDELDDPEGIAVPWEEKYGKKKNKNKAKQ
jgi:His-Xaa-Ser system protein HxsD